MRGRITRGTFLPSTSQEAVLLHDANWGDASPLDLLLWKDRQSKAGVKCPVCPPFSPIPFGYNSSPLILFYFFEGGFQKQPEPGKSLAKQLLSKRQVGDGKVGKALTIPGGQRPKPPAACGSGKEGERLQAGSSGRFGLGSWAVPAGSSQLSTEGDETPVCTIVFVIVASTVRF